MTVLLYIYQVHELVVRAQQLSSVAQLVRALHRNRRAAGSIPARGPKVAFFAAVPGTLQIPYIHYSQYLLLS